MKSKGRDCRYPEGFQHPGAGMSRRGRNLSFLAYAFFFFAVSYTE